MSDAFVTYPDILIQHQNNFLLKIKQISQSTKQIEIEWYLIKKQQVNLRDASVSYLDQYIGVSNKKL